MDDMVSRQAAIDAVLSVIPYDDYWKEQIENAVNKLPSAQPENQVHLCDSCRHVYPECPSGKDDVIFGNGKGNDNICACNKYESSAQPEPCEDAVSREAVSEWLKQYGQDVLHGKYKFSLMYIWKNLMDLPSTQPERKKGE